MKKIVIGELFCGPGGIAIGAELANKSIEGVTGIKFEHGWAVDYHEETVGTYLKNVAGASEATALCKDVRRITATQLKNCKG